MAHRILYRNKLAAFAILALAVLPGQGSQLEQNVAHVSPDQAVRARIRTDVHGESFVRFEDTRDGRLLLVRDDTSSNGLHGHGVVHGAWTADSQFFVAGLESSGGHQPWSHPIWVYSRAANHVMELSALGLTVVSGFQLRRPDILQTRVLAAAGNGRRAGRTFTVSLRTLLAAKHTPGR